MKKEPLNISQLAKPLAPFLAPFRLREEEEGEEEEEEEVVELGSGLINIGSSIFMSTVSSSSITICLHLHSMLQNALSPLFIYKNT